MHVVSMYLNTFSFCLLFLRSVIMFGNVFRSFIPSKNLVVQISDFCVGPFENDEVYLKQTKKLEHSIRYFLCYRNKYSYNANQV